MEVTRAALRAFRADEPWTGVLCPVPPHRPLNDAQARVTLWATAICGRRLCLSSEQISPGHHPPPSSPSDRRSLSRDPRDFHHGLLGEPAQSRACHRSQSPVSHPGLTTGLTVTDLTDRRHVASMGYCRSMGEPIRIPAEPLAEEAPPEAAAAIRRGLDDVEAGRVTPIEEVRKLIPKWTARSSSPTRP